MSQHAEYSRRRFLGLAGITSMAAGLTCATGAAGYLLVTAVRRSHGAAGPTATPRPLALKQIDRPTIISRADWRAREPDHDAENESGFYSLLNEEGWREYEGDLRDTYTTVVVHHSVIVESDDEATMREIQDLHMDDRGWADIAYHFGVGTTGAVFEGRALDVRGTHVEGANTGSVGVVFFGNFEETVPTAEQLEAGQRLIDWLALRLELNHLAGHKDFNDFTDCPGRNLSYYLEALAESAGLELGTGGYGQPKT
jgi:hypothetical protein